ncbi:MAG: CoA-binding protein [Treponema sp.]|nr:CoA-binding protein [Treponema sp.]
MSETLKLPEASKKRMVQLLQILKAWPQKKITSAQISEITGWKDSLIRHDFWLLGKNLNGVSNGYSVENLIFVLEELICDSSTKNCCIVGLGRLGAALLDQSFFESSGFEIKVGFDSNLYRVEILRSSFPLYPADDMPWVIKQEKIEYAILSVQNKDAQAMTDRLVKTGIKGIVNLTQRLVKTPASVKVENLSIINALNLLARP